MRKLLLFAIAGASAMLAGNASADYYSNHSPRYVVESRNDYGRPYRPAPTYRPESGRSLVASVQRRLRVAGYYRGPIDGLAGRGTSAAIYHFQRANGLRPTGDINRSLLNALRF